MMAGQWTLLFVSAMVAANVFTIIMSIKDRRDRPRYGVSICEGSILRLEPNDLLVFTTPQLLFHKQREQVQKQLKRFFGERTVLVLDGGQSLSVLKTSSGDPLDITGVQYESDAFMPPGSA